MKKVFLYAYDHVNLGDDLFVYTITQRYPNTQFYLWSLSRNRITFQSIRNLKVIATDLQPVLFFNKLHPSFAKKYKDRLCKRCDAVVYIGGSIFIEYPEWNNILNWWEYAANNYSLYILGANFGPYVSEGYKLRLGNILRNAQDVCFRDQYSWGLFQENANVRYAPDILFGIQFPISNSMEIEETERIFFSVIDCSQKKEGVFSLEKYENNYVTGVCKLIIEYQNKGYKITLSSFCKDEGDEKAITKILNRLPNKYKEKCDILAYNGENMQQMLEMISSSSYIVATRFHAAILGIAAGKPIFPLIYSDKTAHILQDIGFEGSFFDIRTEIEYNYETSVKNLDEQYILDAKNFINHASDHFSILDGILE